MLIPSSKLYNRTMEASLLRRVNANSQPVVAAVSAVDKLIKKGEC